MVAELGPVAMNGHHLVPCDLEGLRLLGQEFFHLVTCLTVWAAGVG